MKRLVPLLLLLPLAGCRSMLVLQMQQTPIENRLYLHDGYKAGDWALYEAMDGGMHVRLEILAVAPGKVDVALTWPKAPAHVSFMTGMVRRMILDESGQVLEAWMEDRSGGSRRPLRIAKPGDPNYLADEKAVAFSGGADGKLKASKVLLYTVEADNLVISQKVTTTLFLDPKAPFCLVRRVDVYHSRLPILRLYQKALDLASAPLGVSELYGFILGEVESGQLWQMNLVDRG